MQIVVHFRKTMVLQFGEPPLGGALRRRVRAEEMLPEECDFYLLLDGRALSDEETVSPSSSAVVRASMKVMGGKGGFGAMLKSMAKQSGSKKTTDFGACRDLSGRRLRHVNDEIVLKKWQEARDRGEDLDTTEDTKTGIDLWFLDAPSWADGFKSHYRKKYMKTRSKTCLCLDWLNARADGQQVPAGAPAWWGCPRGPSCEFAHGEDELRGEGKKQFELRRQAEKKESEQHERDSYLGAVESNKSSLDMQNAVAVGLGRSRKTKSRNDHVKDNSDVEKSAHRNDEELKDNVNDATIASNIFVPSNYSAKYEESGISDAPPDWLRVFRSSASSEVQNVSLHSGGVVECNEGFGTVIVHGSLDISLISGPLRLYYEVDLISSGLLQIGWVDQDFNNCPDTKTDGSSIAAAENGVGDDKHSWAYDGFRQMIWNEENFAYPKTQRVKRKGAHDGSGIWKSKDTIGCLLEINRQDASAALSFYVNGCDLGIAFGNDCDTLKSSAEKFLSGTGSMLPGISLEEHQKAGVNIGQRPFKHNIEGATSIYSILKVGKSNLNEQVSCATKKIFDVKDDMKTCDTTFVELNLNDYASADDLALLGLEHLKAELERRELKAGGSLQERAQRLFAVRGLSQEEIPKKFFAKKSK